MVSIGRCSSGVVCEIHLVGSEFSEGMRTHTLFEYPLGKPVKAKLLKELMFFWGGSTVNKSQNYALGIVTKVATSRTAMVTAGRGTVPK